MKRLSELQYISRMQQNAPELNQPDVTSVEVDSSYDMFDTFGAEPADITSGDLNSEMDFFDEPADVTPADYGLYEARNHIATRQRETKNEQKLIDLESELAKWESVANKSDKEAVAKRKELKKQIAQLKKKIGLPEVSKRRPFENAQAKAISYAKKYRVEDKFNDFEGRFSPEKDESPYPVGFEDHLDDTQLQEGVISPRELVDPSSEFYIGDDDGRIMPDVSSLGNIRNDDNEYVDIENRLGRDAADFMRDYNNSPKQRMSSYLFDNHEWKYEDDQSDWNNQIEYFYGDLRDKFSDQDDWDEDIARDVATTHMYGHPRWDEKVYGSKLERALVLYETANGIREFMSRVAESSAIKIRNLLLKQLNGTALRLGNSNPYSGTQALRIKLSKKSTLQLPQTLLSAGFEESNDKRLLQDWVRLFVFIDDPRIKVTYDSREEAANVGIVGPKKAKRSSLPYYD
jgi:hypothetical protein